MAVITITRGVQCGGRELARQLAERLGYTCMSREVIAQCAKRYNIMESDLYERLMEAPGRWRRLTQTHRRYLIYIKCSLIDAAKQDNVIYHGYAGQLFLKGVQHALKLRLDAPFETRVEAEMREYGKSREDAVAYIANMDEQRNKWMKYLYDREWNDPAFYDLSINLENLTIDAVCDIVESILEKPTFETTEASINGLNNLSLACEVEAALASDDKLWKEEISVRASGSTVILRGTVRNDKTRTAIIDTATSVKGVEKCDSYIELYSDPIRKNAFGDS
jgi:cytidylate kinase